MFPTAETFSLLCPPLLSLLLIGADISFVFHKVLCQKKKKIIQLFLNKKGKTDLIRM